MELHRTLNRLRQKKIAARRTSSKKKIATKKQFIDMLNIVESWWELVQIIMGLPKCQKGQKQSTLIKKYYTRNIWRKSVFHVKDCILTHSRCYLFNGRTNPRSGLIKPFISKTVCWKSGLIKPFGGGGVDYKTVCTDIHTRCLFTIFIRDTPYLYAILIRDTPHLYAIRHIYTHDSLMGAPSSCP